LREINPIELGGTMYVPSINKNLLPIASGEKFPYLKSIVICFEDAIKEEQVEFAIKNVANFLKSFEYSKVKVFLRARNIDNLKKLLKLEDIEKIDGFAVAKFSTQNMQEYYKVFCKTEFYTMPVLESRDLFEIEKLKEIREFLLTQKRILTIRIGGEDMFKYLGIKKECDKSIHDFHVSSKIFADILSVFKPYGFTVCAPVYNCLENEVFFKSEVQRDIQEGFFGKTVIHPKQAQICNEIYQVSTKELAEAKEILDNSNEAIFRFEDKMCEPEAHQVWARNILMRYEVYGLK
jgi:citrate lyase beta subunit